MKKSDITMAIIIAAMVSIISTLLWAGLSGRMDDVFKVRCEQPKEKS